jgi:carboxyl-terminal processing protease
MRFYERAGRALFFVFALFVSSLLAAKFGSGNLWKGFEPALAIAGKPPEKPQYDLTRLEAVNETLKYIRKKYVDPDRIKPRLMLLSALNYVQRDVPQVMVRATSEDEVVVQVGKETKAFSMANVKGPWDVAARLREVFAFLMKNLEGSGVDLRELEYTACNGMLHTLDPHSVFLSPEAYRDMNVQTSGAFGGLGIVISVRDQQLTVMRPMPGTPADRAGIKRFDRIAKIDNESTLNMPLDDAVRRLRGEENTPVTLWIVREGEDGWTEPRPFPLTREIIKVKSVESRPLDGGVLYLKIKNFQSSTTEEVIDALARDDSDQRLSGLVMDLRGNPGGLLDQSVKLADLFLEEGVLVETVGFSEGTELRRAVEKGTEPPYPIVVLVNGSSASASEILAGALKNLDRALIVGQQTFGKGSVQLVFPEVTPEKAALKLTIAQYLTPNSVSIQGVGITPDIELDAMTVDALEMDLAIQNDALKERELFASLQNERTAPPTKPEEVVRYHFSSKDRERVRELGSDAEDEVQLDFPVRFARDLVAAMPADTKRLDQLAAVRPLIEKTRREELDKVAKELAGLGVDWSPAPSAPTTPPKSDDFEVTVESSAPGDTVIAGNPMTLKVRVKNVGEGTLNRLRAQTESESGYFDARELVFGKIGPGEERTAVVPFGYCDVEGRKFATTKARPKDAKRVCKIPADANERADGVKIKFDGEGGELPRAAEFRPTVRAVPKPTFRYSFQVVDDRSGNGDGRVQRGEGLTMYLTVKNEGPGVSPDTQANLANLSGDGLLLKGGRFNLGEMKPGDVRSVAFTFDVQQNLADASASVALSIGDVDVGDLTKEKLRIPVESPLPVASLSEVRMAGAGGATLLESPRPGARGFGTVPAGTALEVIGKVDGFLKVRVEGERFAFTPTLDLESASTTGSAQRPLPLETLYAHAPPDVTITSPQLATTATKLTLKGTASSRTRIADVYAFVGGRKFFYQANGTDSSSQPFELEVPLRPGVNVVNVFARESPDSTTRKTLVIRRDSESGALMNTPKGESAEDWLVGLESP